MRWACALTCDRGHITVECRGEVAVWRARITDQLVLDLPTDTFNSHDCFKLSDRLVKDLGLAWAEDCHSQFDESVFDRVEGLEAQISDNNLNTLTRRAPIRTHCLDEEEVLVLGCRDSHVRRVRHEDREVRRIDILAVLVDQLIGEASCVTRLILDEKCFVEIDKVLLATEVESLQST